MRQQGAEEIKFDVMQDFPPPTVWVSTWLEEQDGAADASPGEPEAARKTSFNFAFLDKDSLSTGQRSTRGPKMLRCPHS